MTAIWMRARGELRSRLGSVLALALIVGVLGGVVMAAAAGAKRTDTAYERFNRAENGLDVVVDAHATTKREARRVFAEVARLPQAEDTSEVAFLSGLFQLPGARRTGQIFPLVSVDGGLGTRINGMKILEGRMYSPDAPDEIVPSFVEAQALNLHVGQVLTFEYGNSFGEELPLSKNPPPPVRVRVVGIGAAPGMFKPLTGTTLPAILFSPAFVRAHPQFLRAADMSLAVVLRHGYADAAVFAREVRAIRLREANTTHVRVGFSAHRQTVGIEDSTHVQAIALWLLAVLVALAGLAVFAQAMARQTFLESMEYPTLRSVGMTPNQLLAVGMIRSAAIGVAGAAIAVVVAYLLSTFTPTGVARIAEPDPGFAFDPVIFGIGAVAVAAVVALIGAIPAWRAAIAKGDALGNLRPRRSRASSLRVLVARSALPPSASTGVRMAFEPGRGRTAVPVRTTMFGAALSLVALAAALSFGASLDHLVSTPRLSGTNWDALVYGRPQQRAQLIDFVDNNPRIEGWARGTITGLQVDGVAVTGIAMQSRRGNVTPSIVEGRLPHGFHEVMLGSDTARKLDKGIGDTVRVQGNHGVLRMRVVGRVAIPTLFFSFGRPGQGVALPVEAIRRLSPRSLTDGVGLFVRYEPGPSAITEDIQSHVPHVFVIATTQESDVQNLNGVGNVPLILAGIVSLMAAVTLAHTLITSIRRRRLDLAILKTLGFVRHEISATVAWQATALAAVALLVGLPIGIIVGRLGWNIFADNLGVVPESVVPLLPVLLAIPATIVVANLLAVVPGRIASRLRAAPVLRSE